MENLEKAREIPPALHEQIMKQAYAHPKFASHRFSGFATVCPQCSCEYVVIVQQVGRFLKMLCQYCSHTFTVEREIEVA